MEAEFLSGERKFGDQVQGVFGVFSLGVFLPKVVREIKANLDFSKIGSSSILNIITVISM